MTEHLNTKFNRRAVYRIEVEGKLDESWSEMFGGMAIQVEEKSKQNYITILTGMIKDQAELSGILNGLYNMHFSVLAVHCLDTK